VNDEAKYPITSPENTAIECHSLCGAIFGNWEIVIDGNANKNTYSLTKYNGSYNLPTKGEYPSLNGGELHF